MPKPRRRPRTVMVTRLPVVELSSKQLQLINETYELASDGGDTCEVPWPYTGHIIIRHHATGRQFRIDLRTLATSIFRLHP